MHFVEDISEEFLIPRCGTPSACSAGQIMRAGSVLIRPEVPENCDAIAEVNRSTLKGEPQARLVNRLREDGEVIASLVVRTCP